MERKEIEIDLRDFFLVLREKFLLILATGLFVSCLFCVFTAFVMLPVYTSTSSILVLTKETTLASLADLQMGSQLTNDYEVLITNRPVLESVIEKLGLDMEYTELREDVSVRNPMDTRILEISVENSDPETARMIANELTGIASKFIESKMEVVPPKLIEDGALPVKKTRPVMWLNALLGLLTGVLLCVVMVMAMMVWDDTIKSEDDIERYLAIPTLATVPDRKDYINNRKKKRGKRKTGENKRGRFDDREARGHAGPEERRLFL